MRGEGVKGQPRATPNPRTSEHSRHPPSILSDMTTFLLALVLTVAPADLVVRNALVWTDGTTGFATSLAVDEGVFVYVGDDPAAYIGSGTTVVDAEGKTVIPGLIDSHIHMLGGGGSLTDIQLRDATDKRDFIKRIKDYAEANPQRTWITGGRWSTESWADKTEPTREWLDEAVPDRPALLSRMDGHSAIANTKALQLAGVTRNTPDPDGGRIVKDANGEPTGLLRETAMGLVSRHVPAKPREVLKQDLVAAMRHANANGITSVSDIPGEPSLPIYQEVQREHGFSVRFALYPTMSAQSIARTRQSFQEVEDWLEFKGVKVYMDGTLGSRTAWMFAPFNNNPADVADNTGLPRPGVADGSVAQTAGVCADNGLQMIGHAIGDRANYELVEFFKGAWTDLRGARPRLEHAQHLRGSDIPAFARLGVIASYQPFHKADDGRYCESYIGADRSASSYAYKDYLDAGGVIAFGSDWPVVTLNPFLGIEAAVTGKTLAGQFWQTKNNITVTEALRGYTSAAAFASFREKSVGRISPGLLADFVILDTSVFGASPDWSSIKPSATYVGGKLVYKAE